MSSDTEKKLLDIVGGLPSTEKDLELIIEETITQDDISDITSSSFSRVLTNTDYLILVDLSSGKGVDTLSDKYDVSKNYIKKLMRSKEGSELLKDQAKQKTEMALALSSSTVAEGLLRYQQYVDDLFAKGQTSLALSYLFGKQSLSEVQAALHKQMAGETPDATDGLTSLFSSLLTKREE